METGGGSAVDRRGAFRVGETKSKERNKREWEEDEGVDLEGRPRPGCREMEEREEAECQRAPEAPERGQVVTGGAMNDRDWPNLFQERMDISMNESGAQAHL
ncbi:unnamed protein product [Pleuronectes platessa]|uniref:Uncharacterized protein n=1 Tax=Pleuronectes platessa TaxID=8262 RepID=A0A9N7TP50_PLEPL|nr:unnamed protein product [Pleuronectes platessa]